MESQRVTIFAPKSSTVPGFRPLPKLQQEINAINRHHEATTYGEVVRLDLLRAATEVERADIFHFAGHLTEAGFIGSNEIIPVSSLIMAIETCEPKLAIFNVCTSQDVAEQIASRCPTDCIFTLSDVEDIRAVEFAIAFYTVLRRDDVESYQQACTIVDPQDEVFRYITGRRKPRLVRSKESLRMDELARQIAELNRSLYELRARLDAEILILKSRDETTQQLISAIKQQIGAMDRQSVAAEQLKNAPPSEVIISQLTLLRIGIGVLLLALIIIFVIWWLFWRS